MSFRNRLLLNFAALFAAFALLLLGFQYHRERQFRRELLEERLGSYADIVSGAGLSPDSAGVDSVRLSSLVRLLPSEVRLTVIDSSGRVLFESSGHAVEEMGNHLHRPEVASAQKNGSGSDIRFSETEGKDFFYLARRSGPFTVRMATAYDARIRHFLQADNVFLWFVMLVFTIALLLLLFVSGRFSKSVTALRSFVRSADRGLVDYDHLHFPSGDLGDVARSVTAQYRKLEESGRIIRAQRKQLLRHFHYFAQGIAIFSVEKKSLYANQHFVQYVNVILDRPTPCVDALWDSPHFKPVVDFLALSKPQRSSTEEAPVFTFPLQAGSVTFNVQTLVYADGSFEITLTDVTQAEKNRLLKQQMSHNITHELRTPVSSISGYLETLLSCPNLSEEQQTRFLQKAHAQTLRLTDLIRDVALISKTEEAPELMPVEEIDIRQVVDEAAEEFSNPLEEAGIRFCSELPELTIRGNYTLVHAIFRNLLENAVRYAGHGVEVHVVCYSVTSEFAYFSFYDTGCGVEESHLPRLFERFYRVDRGRTRADGGTGLGLSIVRNAVAFHRGTISVRNRKEGGLEFLFSLHV